MSNNILAPYPDLPVNVGAGALVLTHPQGLSDEAFVLLSATEFHLVNLKLGGRLRLPNPPGGLTWGAGVTGLWDSSRGAAGRLYIFGPAAGPAFAWWHHFDVATWAWDVGGAPNIAALTALLAAPWGTDAALAHPCTGVALAASDDFVYLTGNNGLPFYRYNITEPGGAEWTTVPPAARAVAAGAGCTLAWPWGVGVDRLYSVDGGGVGTMEYHGIAGDAWAAVVPVPVWTTLPTTGTCSCTSGDGRLVYIRLNATGEVYSFNPLTLAIRPVGKVGEATGSDGTAAAATVGRKMSLWRKDGDDVLVVLVNGTPYMHGLRLRP